jgi:ubiquinol-cytochrome c reductase cytochrome b subunit
MKCDASHQHDASCKPCCAKIRDWIDYRLPIFSSMQHLQEYRAPKNLSYMWSWGSIAMICLMVQIITGVVLAMHYTPNVHLAFESVERIMRDVNHGWLIRYTHAVGASMFFAVVFAHILRGLYYGSYRSPREVLWWLGIIILLVMMATAFLGYVLPWGQMSYWGATVITNLFSAIPVVGEKVVSLLWGGFSVDNPTLNRFFALHYLLPFIIIGVVVFHVWALHQHGSNNPTGVEVKNVEQDTIPFHPYYTIKDMFGFGLFFLVFGYFVFFAPNALGDPDNYVPANPMVTPPHIVPEWYFLPFYAILRSVPDKLLGVLAMGGAILILAFAPWLDTSPVKSCRYRPIMKWVFWLFVANALMLGYAGKNPADWGVLLSFVPKLDPSVHTGGLTIVAGGLASYLPDITVARIGTAFYFAYFLILMPVIGKIEKPKALPASIAASIKH